MWLYSTSRNLNYAFAKCVFVVFEVFCVINKMVLADLGKKITTALRSLSTATVIDEEVSGYNR